MKKIIAVILTLVMFNTFACPAAATTESTRTANAQIAFIKNVDDTGSNIYDETNPSPSTITSTIPLAITSCANGTLSLSATFEDQALSISGQPAGHAENQHALYFAATSENTNYEVIHMAYIDNAEVNMYFKNYASSVSANHILQVYLRDLSSNTKDFIFLEIFDYELTMFSLLIATVPQDTTLGSWFAREFSPKNVYCTDTISRMYTENQVRTYRATFDYYLYEVTHTISIAYDCTYSNIPVGQTADVVYLLEVVGKTIECPDDPTQNSSSESYLHVDTISLEQTTIPNVAFISQRIDGIVHQANLFGELSASISVGYGPLSVSLTFPNSYLSAGTVDIDSSYSGFVNGRNGNYTRSVKTTMDSNYSLTQIGYYFEVRSTLGDFGNNPQNRAYHCASWDITIVNMGNMTYTDYSKNLHVPIGIT